jgi:DtxR family transcriptional regulator, Mn-dependent transcriptional regulator
VIDLDRRTSLTRSQQDYLKALYQLHGDQRIVPTGDLAQRLSISSPSVSEMVAKLSAQGLVEHHRLLEMFLVQVLGYSWDEVHDEAERLEHVISERMEARIFELLGRPQLDPHGHSIPSLTGKVRSLSDRTLNVCAQGEKVIVQGVSDDDSGRLRELERRGLVPGARIEIVAASRYEAPIECRIKGRRVSVPLGLARAVFVEAEGDRTR